MDRPIDPCPFCNSTNVARHFARSERGGADPGCLDCKETRPLDVWQSLVAAHTEFR